MKRHRNKCEIWSKRDKNSVTTSRYKETVKTRYGVENVMELSETKDKIKNTCLSLFNDVSNLGKLSTQFHKVQKNNRIQKYLSKTIRSHKNKHNKIIDFSVKDVDVKKITWKEAKPLLDKYHYAKSGRSPTVCFGGFVNNELALVIKLATVVRESVATSLGISHKEVLELDRMCVRPNYQKKNILSFTLSKTVKMIRTELPGIRYLVSFADSAQGHTGAVYKASNWKYLGDTSASYAYLDTEGNLVNKKSVYNRARKNEISEKQEADECGYIKIPLPPKHKFGYAL